MLNAIILIKDINNKCKNYFTNSHFELKPFPKDNPFIYRIEGFNFALNRNKNNPEKIKVLHWFDDFWLFLELRFIDKSTFISLSVLALLLINIGENIFICQIKAYSLITC